MSMADMQRLVRQAQQAQQELVRVQNELGSVMVDGSAGGGVVKAVVTGKQGMIGAKAEAVSAFSDKGTVRFGGELWKARTRSPLTAGQAVRIVDVEGLVLWVEPT